jgi:outer membrane protein
MSLMGLLRNSRALSLFAIWLVTLPAVAQQQESSGAQQPGNSAQTQPGSSGQTQQGGASQAQPGGITPAMLVVPPAPKFPKPTGDDYTRPAGYWPNPFAPYKVRNVPEANYSNVTRLEDMIHDGKIMLSLNDAIALGLADNLDIAIARYNLPIADTDLLRTRAGSFNSGVGLGLVTGTLGGSGIAATSGASGAGAGGTTVGSGGVGAGASGVDFDPRHRPE